jgi:glycosyltransferase involved in cell wall biosynthesis
VTRDLSFTCLLPVYRGDEAANFTAALESLAASTLRPARILICQDGALPDDLQWAVDHQSRGLGADVVQNPGPGGLHHNLNHAASHVTTPWIARFDADDLNMPERFEAQVDYLRAHPQVTVLGGHILEFWPDGREQRRRVAQDHDDILRMARWRSPMNHMTTFFSTELFLRCGGYPDIPRKEDYALWLTMIGAGGVFANLDQDLVRARLGRDFYRRRAGLRNIASEWKLYQIKAAIPGLGNPGAAIGFVARSAALTLNRPAQAIYQGLLR